MNAHSKIETKEQILSRCKEDLIPCGMLKVIWPDSQQPFVPRHATKIAEEFSWELVGEVMVCGPFKDGLYHVIDGQHRVHAVEHLYGPLESVPCKVYPPMDKARAAWLFRQINANRRRPNKLALFKTAVTAGHEPEVLIAKTCKAIGYQIGGTGISSCTALEWVHKQGGDKLLVETLVAIRETWGQEQTKNPASAVIRSFAAFLKAYPECNHKRLFEVVCRQYTLPRFEGAIKSNSAVTGSAATTSGTDILVRTYNAGLRTGKLEAE